MPNKMKILSILNANKKWFMAKINKKTKFMNNVKFNRIKLISKNENKP